MAHPLHCNSKLRCSITMALPISTTDLQKQMPIEQRIKEGNLLGGYCILQVVDKVGLNKKSRVSRT